MSPKKNTVVWDSVSDNVSVVVQDTTETGNTESALQSINEASFYTQQLQSIGGLTVHADNT